MWPAPRLLKPAGGGDTGSLLPQGPGRQAGPAATCRRKAVGFIYTKSSRWSLPCMDETLAGGTQLAEAESGGLGLIGI